MQRHITVTLGKRGVSCTALLLDDMAPRTCNAVWDALPQRGQVFHAKYARNEIFALVPRFEVDPGMENTTVTPIPGDLCYFLLGPDELRKSPPGFSAGSPQASAVDLALFYERNNLLLNGDVGWAPGNVFGSVVDGLDRMAVAGEDIWVNDSQGETLTYARV